MLGVVISKQSMATQIVIVDLTYLCLQEGKVEEAKRGWINGKKCNPEKSILLKQFRHLPKSAKRPGTNYTGNAYNIWMSLAKPPFLNAKGCDQCSRVDLI